MIPAEKLKSIPMFKDFSEEHINQFSGVMDEEIFKPEQIIFKEGTTGNALYIINFGRVEIKKNVNEKEDDYKILAIFEQGDYFGEMSLLEDKPRSASACAQEETSIFILKREDFLKLLQSSPQVAVDQLLGLLKIISDRLRKTSLELTTLHDLSTAIASMNNTQAISISVIEKLQTVLAQNGFVWIALWNQFNEEYTVITGATSAKNKMRLGNLAVLDKTHPIISLAKGQDKGFMLNSGQSGIIKNISKFLISPMKKNNGEQLGIVFVCRTQKDEDFKNADLILLSTVSSFASMILTNVSFMQEELQRARLQQGKHQWQ